MFLNISRLNKDKEIIYWILWTICWIEIWIPWISYWTWKIKWRIKILNTIQGLHWKNKSRLLMGNYFRREKTPLRRRDKILNQIWRMLLSHITQLKIILRRKNKVQRIRHIKQQKIRWISINLNWKTKMHNIIF